MQQIIVITGGPSGGKTTLIHALQKEFGVKVSVIPEAASILYGGGFPRKDSLTNKVHTQRAICHLQFELEEMIKQESKTQLIICDRGRLDSVAYWPEESDTSFFNSLNTNLENEVQRYNWVLHMDTAAAESFDTSNPIRLENHKQALELNAKILKAWEPHPKRIVISHHDDFLTKMAKARSVIQLILKGESYEHILNHIKEVSVLDSSINK